MDKHNETSQLQLTQLLSKLMFSPRNHSSIHTSWTPRIRSLPKMGFPRGVFPPKVKTWEWSAVTTVRVSDSLVSCAARWMAWSNITASVRASLAMPSWWPWSIRPRKGRANKKRIKTRPIKWLLLDHRPKWMWSRLLKFRVQMRKGTLEKCRFSTHLRQTGSIPWDSCWGCGSPSPSSPQ